MKKYIAVLLAASTLFVTAHADTQATLIDSYVSNMNAPCTFTDMSNVTWAAPSVEFLTAMGIVNGFDDGTFRPDSNITKAEFVKIIICAFGLYDAEASVNLKDNNKDDWYYTYVSVAIEKGIAKADKDNCFNAESYITREEMFDISKKALDYADISLIQSGETLVYSDADEINPEYKDSVDYMSSHGIITGNPDGTLCPKANSTRAEASVMLTRMIESLLENEKNLFDENNADSSDATGENTINAEDQE